MADRPLPDPLERLTRPAAVPEVGGDAACWLAAVCPACGAMNEGPAACWNCGRSPSDDQGPPR